MTALSPHFDSAEFRCKDGSEHPIDPRLLDLLERIRAYYRRPIIITSGYRSPAYNAAVGGASKSYHLRGMAADIQVQGVKAPEVAAFCARNFPLAGVGSYPTWVHIDCRGYRARWGFPARTPAAKTAALLVAQARTDTPHATLRAVVIDSTKWTLVRALAEIAAAWAWAALRDWRVSPEELLDLARQLLDFAESMQHEAGADQPPPPPVPE